MLQENSFFSRPMTYFGTPPHLEEETDEEEWELLDPWQMALDSTLSHPLQQRIGLFIHWCDPND